jgi:hypothetical protein
MTSNADTSPAGEIIYYRGPGIVVTSGHVANREGRFRVRDLQAVDRVEISAHPALTIALVCGAIELVLAVLLAVTFGSAVLICAGLVTAAGLGSATLVDARRNPRWMALRAFAGGRQITLFSSCDRQEFEQVRRAVIRVIEVNTVPQVRARARVRGGAARRVSRGSSPARRRRFCRTPRGPA